MIEQDFMKEDAFYAQSSFIYRRLNANIYLSIIITFEQDTYYNVELASLQLLTLDDDPHFFMASLVYIED